MLSSWRQKCRNYRVPYPNPLNVEEAFETLDAAEDMSVEPWHGKRDRALFALLYGCGLRISEALGLSPKDIINADKIVVTGKGNKQRIVPVLKSVSDTINEYVQMCPL